MDTAAVVLVPGIFASPLDSAGGIGWPLNSARGLAMMQHVFAVPMRQRDDFLTHRTSPHGGVQPRGEDEASLGWGTVATDFYRPFLDDCSKAGDVLRFAPKVFASGYNWLHSNRASGSALDDTVKNVLLRFAGNASFRGIFFVTHSMGALNVLETLRQLEARRRVEPTAPNWIDQVLGVVHVAAPLLGAPEVIMRFVRGVEGDFAGSLAFGNAGWKCLTSASAVMAGFELMPFPSVLAGAPSVVRRPDGAALPDDPFYVQTIFRTVCDPTFSYEVRVVEGTTTVDTKTRTQPGTVANQRRIPTIFNQDRIAADLAQGMRDGLEFHRRLNRYRFPYSGAVVLRGVPTVQKVTLELSFPTLGPPVIGNVNRLQVAEASRSNDGDGTVPVSSQSDIPLFSLPNAGLVTDMVRTVSGIQHAAALQGKTDRSVFTHVYGLLNHLQENARQRKLGGFR
jgi:Lecithin:cholesterol acyltransferase